MGMGLALKGRSSRGLKTQSAGTVINRFIPGKLSIGEGGYRTVVTKVRMTAAGTAHVLTCLRPQGKTTVVSAVAASGTTITWASDPGIVANLFSPAGNTNQTTQLATNPAAANDWYAIALPDGTWFVDKISAISSLAVTPTATVPTNGIAAGALVWWFGVAGDNDPLDPEAGPFMAVNIPASATTELVEDDAGIFHGVIPGAPLLLQDSNATAAGTLELVEYGHILI